jgi:hypothetical protein
MEPLESGVVLLERSRKRRFRREPVVDRNNQAIESERLRPTARAGSSPYLHDSGVGRALVELGLDREVIFIGHELNSNSRSLLRSGVMDYLIGRDQEQQVMRAVALIEAILDGRPYHDRDQRQVRILCKHTCS